MRGGFERHVGLFQNLAGDHLFIIRDDAAGVDQFKFAPAIGGFAVDAVARNSRFVAHNRGPLADNRVK